MEILLMLLLLPYLRLHFLTFTSSVLSSILSFFDEDCKCISQQEFRSVFANVR